VEKAIETDICYPYNGTIRTTTTPCNQTLCVDKTLIKYNESGMGVTQMDKLWKPKACVLQCDSKKKIQFIQYVDNNSTITLETTTPC
jgi:hypothetical protein